MTRKEILAEAEKCVCSAAIGMYGMVNRSIILLL